MYVCMYACMYVCMYLSIYLSTYLSICTRQESSHSQRFCLSEIWAFNLVNKENNISSSTNTLILAFFGHKVKPLSIKRLGISSINLHLVNVKCKGSNPRNKIVSTK